MGDCDARNPQGALRTLCASRLRFGAGSSPPQQRGLPSGAQHALPSVGPLHALRTSFGAPLSSSFVGSKRSHWGGASWKHWTLVKWNFLAL